MAAINSNAKSKFIGTTILIVFALACCVLLVGCGLYSKDEDMSNMKQLGESTQVECQFNFLIFFSRGPYTLEVTPEKMVNLTVNGKEYDCLKVGYKVLNIGSEESAAEYATCTVAIDLLNENMEDIGWEVWWKDENGTEVNIQTETLEVGKKYMYYIPLTDTEEKIGFRYIAIADRSGWWNRGTTYWYDMASSF